MTITTTASRLAAAALSSFMALSTASALPAAPSLPDAAYSALTEEENKWTIRLTGAINATSAIAVINQLRALSAKDPSHEIILRIHSGGGEVTAGLAIYDVMQHIPNDIRTVCEGQAQSMALALLAAGTPGKREVLPHCKLMAHQVSGGVSGNITEGRIDFQGIETANRHLLTVLSRHSGWSITQLQSLMQRDLILTPEEAIQMNFIDAVREPVKTPSPNRAPILPDNFCLKPERSYLSVCTPYAPE